MRKWLDYCAERTVDYLTLEAAVKHNILNVSPYYELTVKATLYMYSVTYLGIIELHG